MNISRTDAGLAVADSAFLRSGVKTCTGCGEEKPLDAFAKGRPRDPGGRRAKCRGCTAITQRAYLERKRTNPSPAQTAGAKACTRCGEEKPLTEFFKDGRASDGRASACGACESARTRRGYAEDPARRAYVLEAGRRWRAENPERLRETQRSRYWADPERARERKRRHDAENREEVNARAREHYRRAYADPKKRAAILERNRRRRLAIDAASSPELVAAMAEMYEMPCTYCGATENIQIDHVVPLAQGGAHTLENLTPACGFCNQSKKDRPLSEWYWRPREAAA